ncbi:MAG: lysylphosphatidylglycerol synthase transmembrane domain-containing protein [Bacteroidota bacterium]|nr:lysylphosphatidylglycerol synthase transmembrane domain-containing protein [Bacteroidota bacterium]
MNKRLRTIFQYSFFLGLGIFLVWWSIKDLTTNDRSQIKQALQTARYWLLIPVFGILFLSHLIRAVRWKLLMEPLGYKPSTTNTLFAVFIGYLANQAVPRLGEVLKCTVLARYEKIPADKLVGTIILERVIDALTLLIIFGITLAIQPDIYYQLIDTIFNPIDIGSKKESGATNTISSSLVLLIFGGIIIIVLAIWMIKNKKNLHDLGLLFRKIGRSIWQGLSAVQHLKKRWLFVFLTLSIWALYLAGGYIGFMALQQTQHYGINEAFTVLSAGSVGMIATPGGIGAYAYLLQKTMQVYGLNEGIALAFGWILWLAQTTVILIGGLISFVAMPYYNKRKLREQS